MNKTLLSLFFAVACVGQNVIDSDSRAASVPRSFPEAARPSGSLLWKASLASLAAANTADILTSRNKDELNPLYRGADGSFSLGKGLAVKGGIMAGVAVAEWLLVRHHPSWARPLSYFNFGDAAITAGVVIHNER